MKFPLIIAEAGNNHEGNIDIAIELINEARRCGADLVKFQAGTAKGFARTRADIKRYKKYELGPNGYGKLVRHGFNVGIPVFFSVWSDEFHFLRNLEFFKIAARQCNQKYIDAYADSGRDDKRTFLSIPHTFKGNIDIRGCMPMHCVSEYPTSNPRLGRIEWMKKKFGLPVGYSDHSIGIKNCIAAAKIGVAAIEKHFTLAHDFGPLRDHKLSATPDELKKLVEAVKK